MHRYFVELSYDGSDFFGWQRQPEQISVQQTIEEAFSKLAGNTPVQVTGCGRTDTGVHAKHYVLHVDLDNVDPDQYVYKLNKMLPNSIAIHNMKQVRDDAHARFGATSRTYRYFINQTKDPFKAGLSWYMQQPLNIDLMNEAATHLLGRRDFTSLSKLHTDVKTNICDVRAAKWFNEEDQLVFEITADRFLRNMVRATVGTVVDVGLGKLKPQDILSILDAKDRGAASVSVPADGLFLWKIEY